MWLTFWRGTNKTTSSSTEAKRMSLKKLDDDAGREFWTFVEKSTETWRTQQPRWAREVEHERRIDRNVSREREQREPASRVG
jgi:hypothetical protein